MSKWYRVAGWWAVALCALPLRAETNATAPTELEIGTAWRLAYDHNPTLNRIRQRLVGQSGTLMVSESSRLPNIDAFGLYQLEDESRSGSFGGGEPPDEHYWRAGVEVTQAVYAGGRLGAAVRSRKFQRQAILAEIDATLQQVMTDVAARFYGALLAREIIAVRKESQDLLERQLTLARNRFDAGAVSRFDVLQAEVRLANIRPPLIRAENDYLLAIEALRAAMGILYPSNIGPRDITLKGEWGQPEQMPELHDAIEAALRNRPDLIAAARLKESAREQLTRVKRDRAPRVDLFANYSFENDRYAAEDTTLDGWQAGLQARLNIWEGGRIRGEIIEAASLLDQVSLEESELRLDIEVEVRNAWNRAVEAREILDATKLSISQAEEAFRLAENRYAAGTLTQLDVLASQFDFTQAKLDQLTALHDYTIARLELDRAMGETPGSAFLPEP